MQRSRSVNTHSSRLVGFLAATILVALLAGPSRAQSLVYGIDVSNYQGPSINWTSVKNAGFKFAFAKATEGIDFNDASYAANMTNAPNAGVYIGPYHYARPDSYATDPNDPVNEANDFVDRILQVTPSYNQAPGYFLRPVVDMEESDVTGVSNLKAFISDWVRDFGAVVETRLGVKPIIYASTSYINNYFETNINQFPLWLANWNYTPPTLPPASADGIFNGWDFWQYTSTGPVAGVPGSNVDKDVYQGTMDQLLAEFLMVQPNGDFNNDNDVDGADFLTWQLNHGRTGATATFANGDADGSKAINLADMTVWQSGFGAPAAVGSVAAIPEPSAAALALLAILAAAPRLRHTGAQR